MNKIAKWSFFSLLVLTASFSEAQNVHGRSWIGLIHRPDSNDIAFTFILDSSESGQSLVITNATEKIRVDNIMFRDDSVFIEMPVFESSFKAKVENDSWNGLWVKGTSAVNQVLPFSAHPAKRRFEINEGNAGYNITGRWQVSFASDKSKAEQSVAEFTQKGNIVYGTFLTPSGDYRYQEGVVTDKHLILSGFDGAHAYSFTADIRNSSRLVNGKFFSGAKNKDTWNAVKTPRAKVSTDAVAMHMKPGEEKLNFSFTGTDGKSVSINDDQFKNRVVIVQILGSWCPNCMDETEFLSDYYNKNKNRGVEVVALAYEYSTDFQRSVASIRKFQNRFHVQYPILVTGVKVSDSLRTEKTLPQVTPIKVFPSSIIIDKHGKVRKFDTAFFGPGTGKHFQEYKKEFSATMEALLNEK
ncbi:MAG: TlpA disulfide reductase family protein [Ginsengibacter sp.]